ncbi:MAG: hypothetical protein HZA54_07630 [Planctomycetes bacterium]|nr:hypothetical protein [Planctomycetota bacterium]
MPYRACISPVAAAHLQATASVVLVLVSRTRTRMPWAFEYEYEYEDEDEDEDEDDRGVVVRPRCAGCGGPVLCVSVALDRHRPFR